MKLTDEEILRHLLNRGHIKRSYWKDVYICLAMDGGLQIVYGKREPYAYEISISALVAGDWEKANKKGKVD